MWSHYDEDLSQNAFFKEIKQNHKDILKKSAEENWMICVPRSGSLKNDNNYLTDIILDHILIRDEQNKFITLSKKDIYLEDNHLKVEQNSIFSSVVKLLFEETHYVEETNKYTVCCIERPLFQLPNHCDIPNNNVTLTTIQDCIDFLYAETFGHSVLENVQKLCLDFWKSQEDSFEIESLQYQKDLIGNLYSQCLQLFYKSDVIKDKCNNNEQFLQLFKVSIETYMQYCFGRRLIYSVNTVQHFNDSIFNKIVRNSLDISLKDLNISVDFKDPIFISKYELYRINNCITALDKLNCLSLTFKIFDKYSSDKRIYVTSDDFLQILVYLILQSNIPNWVATLTYLKEFNFATLDNPDQNSFLVTTLEAAIEFIKSSHFLDITHNAKGIINSHEEQLSTLFYIVYSKLKTDRNETVLHNVSKNDINSFCKKIELCHPLCKCEKCEKLITQTSSQEISKIVNKFNQNFLIVCCMENDVTLLEFLLTLKLDINFADSFGKTALHYAAEKGFQDVLLLLVNSKAKVNVLDNERNTPLHLACDKGHENCVKALIYSSYFVEINLQNLSGETPLFLATKWGHLDIIKILLENGGSVCVKNNQNMSVYKLSPNFYVTKLFREFGSMKSNVILEEVIKDISIGPSHSVSDVFEENCSYKVQEQGLLYGYKPKTSLDIKQIDLLIKTVESNDLPLTCFYLGYNSSYVENEKLAKKCHPLCTCSRCLNNDDSDTADFSEQTKSKNRTATSKFNVNTYNNDGLTPLHIAAKFGRTEILRILLDCGAYLNVRTLDTLYTPLHLAVMLQRIQTVKELLKCGDCNVDAQDCKGNTPLYYSCVRNNNLKIVEILLQNRADCQKKNFEEKSILQECEERNLFRVCRMLRESMGYALPKINDVFSETTSSNVSFGDIDSDFEVL